MCFGTLTVSNSPTDDDYATSIRQDSDGWTGKSDLFVSFWVTIKVLLEEPEHATAGLSLSPVWRSMEFMGDLGPLLIVHGADIRCKDDVFVTKERPSQGKLPILCGESSKCATDSKSSDMHDKPKTRIKANLDSAPCKIIKFTAQIDLSTGEAKSILASGQPAVVPGSPCSVFVRFKSTSMQYDVHFPAPVLGSENVTRISHAAPHIEVTVPMADRPEKNNPGFAFPVLLDSGKPVVWNAPFINVDHLPVLDLQNRSTSDWLYLHTSIMFSAREWKLRGNSAVTSDARANFKESLFGLFTHSAGGEGQEQFRVFGVRNPSRVGLEILILVSATRLEPSNHTVFLDTAILVPTRENFMEILPFLESIFEGKVVQITVDKEGTILWKQMIPAFVERCTWEHRPTCEYAVKARVPLSMEDDKPVLCTCSNGVFPDNFLNGIPNCNVAAKHAVRGVISPMFPAPLLENLFTHDDCDRMDHGASASAAGDMGDKKCWNCGKSKDSDAETVLRNCARCHVAKYCPRECQKAQWKVHKQSCNKS